MHLSRIHLAEAYIAENDREVVDTLFRGPFKMTARQAVQKFGRDAHAKLIEMAGLVAKRHHDRIDGIEIIPVDRLSEAVDAIQ